MNGFIVYFSNLKSKGSIDLLQRFGNEVCINTKAYASKKSPDELADVLFQSNDCSIPLKRLERILETATCFYGPESITLIEDEVYKQVKGPIRVLNDTEDNLKLYLSANGKALVIEHPTKRRKHPTELVRKTGTSKR